MANSLHWTRDGWRAQQKTFNITATQRRGYEQTEFESSEGTLELDLIQQAYNMLQIGPIGLEIDKLPGPVKQLLYAPDDWYIRGNKLFRVCDPIDQAQVYNQWGSELNDKDEENTVETTTIIRTLLERSNLITPSDSNETTANVLSLEILKIDSPVLPELPVELFNELQKITKEFQLLIKRAKDEEYETIAIAYEQAVDNKVNPYLTTKLNSLFCGQGYSTPARKHDFIPTVKQSKQQLAAEEREREFYRLFGKAASCSSQFDLYGPIIKDNIPNIEGSPNPNYGKTSRPGGFYGEIRGMHANDKTIASQWSMHPTFKREDGTIVESQFTIQRREFIRDWRTNQKGDEETLRVTLWSQFDRVAGEKPAEYKDGKLSSKSAKFKDSIWRQKRTAAMIDLYLTKPMWDSIYTMLSIIKNRISYRPSDQFSENRLEALKKLRNIFPKIENLSDLREYMNWAEKRKFQQVTKTYKTRVVNNIEEPINIGSKVRTYKFKPNLLDQISVHDELKWRRSCAKKRKHLKNRFLIGRHLATQIISTEQTELPEITIACKNPNCDCMTVGIPIKAIFENKNKLNFINCDGCNNPVWIIDYKEQFFYK